MYNLKIKIDPIPNSANGKIGLKLGTSDFLGSCALVQSQTTKTKELTVDTSKNVII